MSAARKVVRWLLVGRRDGVRAAIRRRLGLFTFLDRDRRSAAAPEAGAPAPAPERPAATPAPADEAWTDLVAADELAPGEVVEVLVGERPIAVACLGEGRFHALDGTCPHAGGPLGDGALEGETLVCPWHGWSYELGTGRSTVDPAIAVAVHEVRVREGRVCARLSPDTRSATA